MVQGFDRSAYLAAFREEMEEHLQALTAELLALESHPDDLSPVGEVFRRIHTVKGSARMMGFGDVADLAHSMEDVLDDLGAARLRPSPPLFDAMLTASDLLRELVRSSPEDCGGRQDVQAVIRWLGDLRESREDGGLEHPAPEAAAAQPSIQRQETSVRETVRVDVQRIDTILNLAGELMVLDAGRKQWMDEIAQLLESLSKPYRVPWDPGASQAMPGAAPRSRSLSRDDVGSNITSEMADAVSRAGKRYRRMMHQQTELVHELHYQISTLRMLPVHSIFSAIPRAARDLAREEGKEVEVVIEGEDTEIDREVLERVRDPVVHLVLNAVVHGIEPPAVRVAAGKPAVGRVRVAAFCRGERAIVEVEDDGAGVDFRAVRETAVQKGVLTPAEAAELEDSECTRLLFLPGFTTNSTVSGRSGRGVGLDVVKAQIDALKGHIWLQTLPRRGTKVTMELPITLAFTHVLLAEVGRSTYGFACTSVQGVTSVTPEAVRAIRGKEYIDVDGRSVRLVRAEQLLGVEGRGSGKTGRWPAILLGPAGRLIALVVDRVVGDENVIVKPLGPLLRPLLHVSGGIILGSGRVALVLSASALLDAEQGAPALPPPVALKPSRAARRVLVVDDVATTRELERGILEAAGYQVETAVDGQDALAKLRLKEFELVVADVEMPRMDGFELAAAIRVDPALSRLPVVVVSSRDSDDDRRRGMQLGVQAYVSKGAFDEVTLLDTIESIIG